MRLDKTTSYIESFAGTVTVYPIGVLNAMHKKKQEAALAKYGNETEICYNERYVIYILFYERNCCNI